VTLILYLAIYWFIWLRATVKYLRTNLAILNYEWQRYQHNILVNFEAEILENKIQEQKGKYIFWYTQLRNHCVN
jgi:hypothetical protein